MARNSNRLFSTLFLALTPVVLTAPSLAQGINSYPGPPRYTVADVGVLGGSFSEATGVNGNGFVVGFSSTNSAGMYHAFYKIGGFMQDLGTLGGNDSYAQAINLAGTIVGHSFTAAGLQRAFRYIGGVMTDLGTLGGSYSAALGISDDGWIAGSASMYRSDPNDEVVRAFRWNPNASAGTEMSQLGTLGGSHSEATAINISEVTVGWANTTGDTGVHAFMFGSAGMQDLGTLGGPFSRANAINDLGDIVGMSYIDNIGTQRAFVYAGGQMINMGTLENPNPNIFERRGSEATAINNARQITGYSALDDGTNPRAIFFSNNALWNLNDLAAPGNLFTSLQYGLGIDQFGRIVGSGIINNEVHAFVATPTVTMNATPTGVLLGQDVTVNWVAPSGSAVNDWIGLYRVGAADTQYLTWRHTNGATSGTWTIQGLPEIGQYEFRYFIRNGYDRITKSNVVTAMNLAGAFQLTATPSTVAGGGAVTVEWRSPTGRPANDWIGLYKVGSNSRQYIKWQYVGGAPQGTKTFTMTVPPGQYNFRYLLNNGYHEAVRSNNVTVN